MTSPVTAAALHNTYVAQPTSTANSSASYIQEAGLLKRSLDIIGALFGLLLAAPVMVVIGALIYRESPGSIIYKQVRLGRNGKPFTIYKLRSMKLSSETNGAGWTVENDPRCLKIGRFIRAWNLDEVPQFWNVLKGDMSLVGPRPERPEHMKSIVAEVPQFEKRLAAKPGLTGLAQVNGWRGDTCLHQRLLNDMAYIRSASLSQDVAIMLKTLIKRDNAY